MFKDENMSGILNSLVNIMDYHDNINNDNVF